VDPAYSTVDTTGTTLRTNFQGFNSLAFLAPYALARGLQARETSFAWRTVLVSAGVLGVVLSGRRMFYLTVPTVTVLGILCLALVLRRVVRRPITGRQLLLFLGSLGIAAVVTAAVVAAVALSPLQAASRTAGQVTVSTQNDVRTNESRHFLDAIEESPVWGHGSGAVVPGHIRDVNRPWAYELTYHSILFDFGLLGSLVLLGWTLWTAWRLWGRIRAGDSLVVAVAAGWVGVLLASVYDPYLLKIDGMWMVFIPFGLAVAASRTRTSSLPSPETVSVR
jgi:O-antigen ligase